MKKKNLSGIAFLLVILMLASVLGACKKEGNDNAQTAKGSTSSTAAASKSAAATAKTTNSQATTAASSKASATGTTTSGGDNNGKSSAVGNSSEDQSGQSDTVTEGGWAEDVNVGNLDVITKEDINLGGRTIVIGTWSETVAPRDQEDKSPELVLWAKRLKEAEEKYNAKFELYVEPGNNNTTYQQKMITQAMSGVVLCDVFRTASSYQFPMFVKNNIILPLDEYIDYESPIIKANSYLYNGSLWKGKHYGVTYQFNPVPEHFFYNSDILGREGQPDILDLIEADNWNWSTFLEIAKNCTRDTDGDGITDQLGLTSQNNLYFFRYIFASNGLTAGVEVDSNGQVYLNIKTPEAIRALQFISDLAFVHKVYKQDPATTGVYAKGKAAMLIYNSGTANNKFLLEGMNTLMANMPKGPDAEHFENIGGSQFYVVSAACKDPGPVIKAFTETCILWTEDLDYIPEYKELESKYYSSDWTWSANNPARRMSTEREYNLVYQRMYQYFKPDFSGGFTNFENRVVKLLVDSILNGSMSVSQAIDSSELELQSIIDEFK